MTLTSEVIASVDALVRAELAAKDAEIARLREALESMLNLESDAAYGAYMRAKANPTHIAMDVEHHTNKARAALAKASTGSGRNAMP